MRSRGKDGIDEERTYEVTRVVKNHMVDGTPSRIVDALLPYGLFFIGMWAGQYLWVMALFGTPIHEMGHVIAAFATGGYGAWDIGAWNQAITYHGNYTVILFAGVFAELIVGTAMAMVLLVFRRATWLGGILWFNAIDAGVLANYQKDWRQAPDAAVEVANQVLNIFIPITWILVVLAFALSIAITIVHLKQQGRPRASG